MCLVAVGQQVTPPDQKTTPQLIGWAVTTFAEDGADQVSSKKRDK